MKNWILHQTNQQKHYKEERTPVLPEFFYAYSKPHFQAIPDIVSSFSFSNLVAKLTGELLISEVYFSGHLD